MQSFKIVEDFKRSDSLNNIKAGKKINGQAHRSSKTSFVDDDEQLFKTRKRGTIKSLEKKGDKIKLRRKKSKRSKENGQASEEKTNNDTPAGKVIIETLTSERLIEGTVILGCLMEIGVFELKFSTTGGLVVSVPITNVSAPYTKQIEAFANKEDDDEGEDIVKLDTFFQVGDYFPIKIVSKRICDQFGHAEIIGSLNPRDVNHNLNTATLKTLAGTFRFVTAVISVEDYGYEIDVGIDEVKAFLPFNKVGNQSKLSIGQLFYCSLVDLGERSLTLTGAGDATSKTNIYCLTDDLEPSIYAYIPGVSTNATVTNVLSYGLELKLPGGYRGFINKFNIGDDIVKPTNTIHKIGDTVTGHVLYVHPHTKQICVSLRPVMKKKMIKSLLSSIRIGAIVEKAVVVGQGQFGSIIFRLPTQHHAIAVRKNLCEPSEYEEFKSNNKFAIGTVHKCRIKKFNLFDNLIEISLKRSVIEREEVTLDELHIGAIVEGVVKKVKKNGLYIQLGFALNGFLPNLHLTDGALVNLGKTREAMFPLKKKVRVRITRLDLGSLVPKISLTAKKSLMKLDQESLFMDFSHIQAGMSSTGVVCLVNENGVLLEFFGRVRGFIPLKNLATYKIEQPEKVFMVGQVLRATVVSVDVATQRMVCTLIDLSERQKKKMVVNAKSDSSKIDNSKLKVGQVLKNLKIVARLAGKGFDLTNAKETIKVFLPSFHCADDPSLSRLLSASLRPGANIEEVLVYSIDAAQVVTVTRKEAFMHPKNALVISEEDLVMKQPFPAVVRNITQHGVFFDIPNRNSGVVRRKFLQDGFFDDPTKLGLVRGQTIEVVAFDVAQKTTEDEKGGEVEEEDGNTKSSDEENFLKKFRFSMKLSDVWNKDPSDKLELMKNYLADYHRAIEQYREKFEITKENEKKKKENADDQEVKTIDHTLEHLISYRIGQVVTYVVTEITDDSILVNISPTGAKNEPRVRGLALKYTHFDGLEVAHMGNAIVCEHDWETRSLLVFIQSHPAKLVKQVKNGSKLGLIKKVKPDQTLKGTVFFVGRSYVLASLGGHAPGLVATVATRRHRNDMSRLSQLYSLGEDYRFMIGAINEETNEVIVVLDTEYKAKKKDLDEETKKKKKKKPKKTPEEIEAKRKARAEMKRAIRLKKKMMKKNETEEGMEVDKEKEEEEEAEEEVIDQIEQLEELDEKPKNNKCSKIEFDWNVPDLSIRQKRKISETKELDDEAIKLVDLWESEDDEDGPTKKKVTREERNDQRRKDEERLRQREDELADLERSPQNVEDFEMAVLASPNSSMVWLKFMAFYLEREEIEKAREVGERALEKISFREEKEKLNLWLGMINLENSYGDESSIEALLERANKYNDPLVIHLQLATIYETSGKLEMAEQVYHTAIKKFKNSTKTVVLEFLGFYMRHGRTDSARKLFQKMLLTLEKKEHVELISKFGLLEFKHGSAEQAKTLFETMLATYWRRMDQWSIYLDALVKYTLNESRPETIDYIRNLYERLITFSFPPAKMRFVFKRYLEYERRFEAQGSARIDALREKAIECLGGEP